MNVETLLTEKDRACGQEAAYRPQPQRSGALDVRLYLKAETDKTQELLLKLIETLLDLAEQHLIGSCRALPICRSRSPLPWGII